MHALADEGIGFSEGLVILLIFVPLALMWGFTLVDLFRRRDLSGLKTVLWLFAIIFLPVIGVFAYFVARPVRQYEVDDYTAAGEPDPAVHAERTADAVAKLAALRDAGDITREEFELQKRRLLS